MRTKLLLMTNRKLNMRFWLTPRLMTMNCINSNFWRISHDFADFGCKNGYTHEDRPIMSATSTDNTVYLHSFSGCCFPNLWNSPKIRTYSSSGSSRGHQCWCQLKAHVQFPIYTPLKSTFNGLQFRRWQFGSLYSFMRCWRNPAKFRENSNLYQVKVIQGHRSWWQ